MTALTGVVAFGQARGSPQKESWPHSPSPQILLGLPLKESNWQAEGATAMSIQISF